MRPDIGPALTAIDAVIGPPTTSLGVRLLADLRDLFARHSTDRLPTTVILTDLRELDEAPWGDLDGKPLDARRLARELRRYGGRPVRSPRPVSAASACPTSWWRYSSNTRQSRSASG